MNERLFKYNSTVLNYVDCPHPKGLPVLLLHGIINRWQSFYPIIPHLNKSFHVYGVDLRGHGKSDRTPGKYNLSDYIQDIDSFIRREIKEAPVIIGHSFGGVLGILLASYYPELVKALVVVDTPLTMSSLHSLTTSQKEQANMFIHWLRFNDMSQVLTGWDNNWLPAGLRSCDPEMLAATINSFGHIFKEYQPDKLLPNIKCPVLLIRGNPKHGSLISEADFKIALKLMPALSHVMIANAGHSPIKQNTQAVIDAIGGFMKAHQIAPNKAI